MRDHLARWAQGIVSVARRLPRPSWLPLPPRNGWRWPEIPVLLAVLAIAGLTWGFIELAGKVVSGDTHRVDNWIVDSLRHADNPALPRGPHWLVDVARDITALGSPVVLSLLTAAAAGYLYLLGERRASVLLVAAVVSGTLLSTALKSGFDRPRPAAGSQVQGTVTASFPSGHALGAAVVYLTLGAMLARFVPNARLRAYAIGTAVLISLLVGLSRIYLGVHYPSDVLAGWTAGAAWALLWWLVARYFWAGRDASVQP